MDARAGMTTVKAGTGPPIKSLMDLAKGGMGKRGWDGVGWGGVCLLPLNKIIIQLLIILWGDVLEIRERVNLIIY